MEAYLESLKSQFPQLEEQFDNLNILAARKLWHQLSLALERLLRDNRTHQWNINVFELYEQFISKVESRLSQVKFSVLLSLVGQTLPAAEAVALFEKVLGESKSRLGPEAVVCVEMDLAVSKLRLGLFDEAKDLVAGGKKAVSEMPVRDTIVYSRLYAATAEYHKVLGPPQDFYRAALMYLAYTPLEDINDTDKFILATDVSLAAITGEGIYNFGEVLATPVLSALRGTANEWLLTLVTVLNNGDIDGFNGLVDTYSAQYYGQPALAAMHEDVKKKLVFLSLMNVVLERHSHDRTIEFSVIASRTRLPLDQIEWVLMRALSLGLIKGSIDQVDQTIDVTWVQPRVLDQAQLRLLSSQLSAWTDRVKTALTTVEDRTSELFV